MDDNKEKNSDDLMPDNGNSEEIQNEMEELAKTFQQELDKAKQEAKEVAENPPEEPEILIQDLEEIPQDSVSTDETEEIPEDELCQCCGEKRKGTSSNPNSDYCSECEKGLRHYPFDFLNIILALAVVAFAVYGCYVFADYSNIYSQAEKAEKYADQGKLYTAYQAYSTVANTMVTDKVNGEMIYKRSIENTMRMGGIGYISQLSTQFKTWELKLPHLKSVYNSFKFVQEFNVTSQDAYGIISKYETADPSEIPYDELMAQLDALETVAPTVQSSTDTTTTTAPYNITASKYSKPMVLFVKYYLSTICGRDDAEAMGYLEEIWEETPDYTWLYGMMLGSLYAKNGKDVTELCTQLRTVNSEDTVSDIIEAVALRIKGDYDGCIEKCNKLISAEDGYTYEAYRQIALCKLATGDYSAAYDNANLAYQEYGTSIQICDTLALCSAAAGNEDTYNEIATLFSDNDLELSEEVTAFKAGTMTIEQIVSEGDFDVE